MSVEPRPDFLARCVAGVVAWVARHPRVVLALALDAALASVRTSSTGLGFHTQRNDLLSADNRSWYQRRTPLASARKR